MVSDLFLSPEELRYLTGIGRGRDGKTREQLQNTQLLVMRIPFRVNARGMPIVTHVAVNGTKSEAADIPAVAWQSNALKLVKKA